MDRRTKKTALQQLSDEVTNSLKELNILTEYIPPDSATRDELNQFATEIKKRHDKFTEVAQQFTSRLISVGGTKEANDVRRQRKTARQDAQMAIDILNDKLSELGGYPVSEIDRFDVSRIENSECSRSLRKDDTMGTIQRLFRRPAHVAEANSLPRQGAAPSSIGEAAELAPPQDHSSTRRNDEIEDGITSRQVRLSHDNPPRSSLESALRGVEVLDAAERTRSFVNASYTESRNHRVERNEGSVMSIPHDSKRLYIPPAPSRENNRINAPHMASTERNMERSIHGTYPMAGSGCKDSSNYLVMRQRLMETCSEPFSGRPEEFHSWRADIEDEINAVGLPPRDVLKMLKVHTTGEPKQVISNITSQRGSDPRSVLEEVWHALFEKYGSGAKIANSLMKKVRDFNQIRSVNDDKQIEDLISLCTLLRNNIEVSEELLIFDFQTGQRMILEKLPEPIHRKWIKHLARHHRTTHRNPNFTDFIGFIKEVNQDYNGYRMELFAHKPFSKGARQEPRNIRTFRTSTETTTAVAPECLVHPSAKHKTEECLVFKGYSNEQKIKLLKIKGRCYRCLGKHLQTNCDLNTNCAKCKGKHITIMHKDWSENSSNSKNKENAGVSRHKPPLPSTSRDGENTRTASTFCSNLPQKNESKSCSKIFLVDLKLPAHSTKSLRCYCVTDEQSNTSFIDPRALEFFGTEFPSEDYYLSTLQGLRVLTRGVVATGFEVKGVTGKTTIKIPKLRTNEWIPDCKEDVATPDVVRSHKNIAHYADKFLELDKSAPVWLLLGRDCGKALVTKCLNRYPPLVHDTPLGFAVVGQLGRRKDRAEHTVLKTSVVLREHFEATAHFRSKTCPNSLESPDIFAERNDDELPGFSKDDNRFLNIISDGIEVNEKGNIAMPLPFREDRPLLPDNRTAVLQRTSNTLSRLKQNKDKLEQCINSMQKNIDAGHVEIVPPDELASKEPGQTWYIPVFPVTHARKGKVRLVFDSSASYNGTSLNQKLLQGPDLNNQLLTVLIRFRRGEIGFAGDVEAMFHAFHLKPKDKDFTRFFWFAKNDPRQRLCEYRATVHIFGNRPSPAVANLGLKYAAASFPGLPAAAKKFVFENFYVDDACGSCDSEDEAIQILEDTRRALGSFNIRLHKLASSSDKVMEAFPPSERSETSKNINFGDPTEHALGIEWKTSSDSFVIKTKVPDRVFSKRGVLSTVNSVYDPLGFVAPVVLTGRLLQRKLITRKDEDSKLAALGWDDALPSEKLEEWEAWKTALNSADGLVQIPRGYYPRGFSPVKQQTLHVFSDASIEAIGYVMYILSENTRGETHVAFLTGNSRVAPKSATSIPRLELCAALDAAIATLRVLRDLDLNPERVTLYTDSKVVLGYLTNTTKRFTRYVTRRIDLTLKCFPCQQWTYVSTQENPADIASRPQSITSLLNSRWFSGPSFLGNRPQVSYVASEESDIELPETVKESALTLRSEHQELSPIDGLCHRVSRWTILIRTVKLVCEFIVKTSERSKRRRQIPLPLTSEVTFAHASQQLLHSVQNCHFAALSKSLRTGGPVPKAFQPLSPFLDENSIIRVGGRLTRANLSFATRHPVLLPANHPLSILIIDHHHKKVMHQGRHLTSGAIREAGFFIQKGSGLIRKFINKCTICRKLRSRTLEQKMSDLPRQRLQESPPFTYTGMDVFGPFLISEGKTTRKTQSDHKCWAVIFTCLTSRAIHIEPLPSLDTSSFKNALRRFMCLRGTCRYLRSDQGTNFVGVRNQENAIDVTELKEEATRNNCTWTLNPPKASHFGGIWERKIASVRRVLEASFRQTGNWRPNRDEFHTLLQEAASIVNNTPMWEVPLEADEPFPLTPAMLMTLRDEPNPAPLDTFTQKDILAYGQRRWRRVQALSEQFWSRWRREYIHNLQCRRKWLSDTKSVQPGDIVLMKDKNINRNHWPLARIAAVKRSEDGLVRSVTLTVPAKDKRATHSTLVRPITDLVLVLSEQEKLR